MKHLVPFQALLHQAAGGFDPQRRMQALSLELTCLFMLWDEEACAEPGGSSKKWERERHSRVLKIFSYLPSSLPMESDRPHTHTLRPPHASPMTRVCARGCVRMQARQNGACTPSANQESYPSSAAYAAICLMHESRLALCVG